MTDEHEIALVFMLGLAAVYALVLQALLPAVAASAPRALGRALRYVLPLWGTAPMAAGLTLVLLAADPLPVAALALVLAAFGLAATMPARLAAGALFARRALPTRARRITYSLMLVVAIGVLIAQGWPEPPCGGAGLPPCQSEEPGFGSWLWWAALGFAAQILIWERRRHGSARSRRIIAAFAQDAGMVAVVAAAGALWISTAAGAVALSALAGALVLGLALIPASLVRRLLGAPGRRVQFAALATLALVHVRTPEVDSERFRGSERTFVAWLERGLGEDPVDPGSELADDVWVYGHTVEDVALLPGRCNDDLPQLRRNHSALVREYSFFGIPVRETVVTCWHGPTEAFLHGG